MRKFLLLALMSLVSLGLALLVLEWAYRSQLVDMYRPELHSFNAAPMLTPSGKPTLLVMGREGPGLSDEVGAICNRFVKIPMAGKLDSLNLAVATAILLYEVLDRRESAGATP